MKKWLGFFGALLFSGVAIAQTTTVVGVATDSDGTLWTNGTVSVQFVPNPSQSNLNAYRINGAPLSSAVTMQGPISLGNSGSFSVTVYDNAQVTPSGSQWQFTVCPNAISKCGSVTTSVTGVSQNITTAVDAAIPAPRFLAVAGGYGYTDAESILSTPVGGTYWNVTDLCQRYYNGSTWNCGSGGGGVSVAATSPILVNGGAGPVGSGTATISCPTCGSGTTTNALTVATSGGAAPNSTFNGSGPVTIDYHSVGAQPELSLLKGTYIDGDLCSYTTSGTLLHCDTAPYSLPSTVVQTNQANTYDAHLQDFSAASVRLPVTQTNTTVVIASQTAGSGYTSVPGISLSGGTCATAPTLTGSIYSPPAPVYFWLTNTPVCTVLPNVVLTGGGGSSAAVVLGFAGTNVAATSATGSVVPQAQSGSGNAVNANQPTIFRPILQDPVIAQAPENPIGQGLYCADAVTPFLFDENGSPDELLLQTCAIRGLVGYRQGGGQGNSNLASFGYTGTGVLHINDAVHPGIDFNLFNSIGSVPGSQGLNFYTNTGGTLLVSPTSGSGYTGVGACTVSGGTLLSGGADTCTAAIVGSDNAVQVTLAGTGVYSVAPRCSVAGLVGGINFQCYFSINNANTPGYALYDTQDGKLHYASGSVLSPGSDLFSVDQNGNIYISGSCTGCGGGGSSPLTTKGDLFGYNTAAARIPVGADTYVLTADSTQALGVKWAAPTGGGSGALSLTPASTGAGATNLATINTCLASGGGSTSTTCYIAGPAGTIYYITGTMVQYSNTDLKLDPGVEIEETTGSTTPVLENYYGTQANISSTGCSSVSGTTCTLNFPSHGFAVGSGNGYGGQYVYAIGSLLYATSATYTSGASSCSNGTQNVSLVNAAGVTLSNVGTITVSGNVPTGAVTFNSPNPTWGIFNPLTGTVTTCTGTASFSLGGTASTDSAFTGVFKVISVPDANNVVVQLNRTPLNTTFGAAFYVNHVDTNLSVENLFYNINGGTGGRTSEGVSLVGVHSAHVSGLKVISGGSLVYGFGGQGMDDVHLTGYDNSVGGRQFKSTVQSYGPVTNTTITDSTVNSGDDGVVFMTSDEPPYVELQPNPFSGGDLLNDTIDGVHGSSAAHCATFYLVSAYSDNIAIKNIDCHTTGSQKVGMEYGGNAGSALFENITCNDDVTYACIETEGTFSTLTLRNIIDEVPNNTAVKTLFSDEAQGSTTIAQTFKVDGIQFYPNQPGDTGINLSSTSIAAEISTEISHYYEIGSATSTTNALLVSNNTGNQIIYMHDGYVRGNGAGGATAVRVTKAGPTVRVDNTRYYSASSSSQGNELVTSTVASTFMFANNNVLSGYMLGCNASITCTVISGGGNVVPTNAWFNQSATGGTSTFQVYRGGTDVSIAANTATNALCGGHCTLGVLIGTEVLNNNITYGQLGPVMSNGTTFVNEPGNSGTGTTGTITGTVLAGTCDSGTASVTGAVVGHPVAVSSTTAVRSMCAAR
jgi:hypothetical protein